jgi:hypothetical protein
MLTVDEFEGLAVDDVIEAPGMWTKLDPSEPIKLRVKTKSADSASFVVLYFGVTVGVWTCKLNNEVLTWEM